MGTVGRESDGRRLAIRKGHSAAGLHRAAYEEHAIRTGVYLVERKRRLGHGEWLPWLAENFEGHQNTAARYMKLGQEWLANSPSTVNLDPASEVPETPEPETPDGRMFTDGDIARMKRATTAASASFAPTPERVEHDRERPREAVDEEADEGQRFHARGYPTSLVRGITERSTAPAKAPNASVG